MPHYFKNVDFIIKDWKESWTGEEITTLIHRMPRDNVIEVFNQPVSDDDVMVSCPLALVNCMRNPDSDEDEDLAGWLFDYGCYDEYDGFYWDGEELQVIYKDKLISMKEWEDIAEALQ